MYYALIDSNQIVTSIIVWDGKNDWTAPPGLTAVKLPKRYEVGIGWSYVNGTFVEPTQPEEQG